MIWRVVEGRRGKEEREREEVSSLSTDRSSRGHGFLNSVLGEMEEMLTYRVSYELNRFESGAGRRERRAKGRGISLARAQVPLLLLLPLRLPLAFVDVPRKSYTRSSLPSLTPLSSRTVLSCFRQRRTDRWSFKGRSGSGGRSDGLSSLRNSSYSGVEVAISSEARKRLEEMGSAEMLVVENQKIKRS